MVVEYGDEVLSVELVDSCTIDVARVLIEERNEEVDIAVLVDERLEDLDGSGVDTV